MDPGEGEEDILVAEFICSLCEELFSCPVYTGCCGASFCRKCIEDPVNDNACPECEATRVSYVQDRRLQKKMKETMIGCKNRSKGCVWSGSILHLAEHLEEEGDDGCPFVPVPCPKKCGAVVERGDLRDHLRANCNVTWVECEHCKALIPSTGEEAHRTRGCPESRCPCPNGCSEVIRRADMAQHRSACPLEAVKCPFGEVGCEVKSLKRSHMQDHLERNQVVHSVAALNTLKQDIKKLQDHLKEVDEERMVQRQELDSLHTSYISAKGEIEDIKEKNMKISSSIAQELEYVTEQPHTSAIKTLSLRTLKDHLSYLTNPILLTLIPNGPPVTFRMPNFAHLKRTKKTFVSLPFIVHNGYQMAIVVHPNGHGEGESTHLSVCLHLVAGCYDNDLQWPLHFEDEVYVSLMRQESEQPKSRGRRGSDSASGSSGFIVQERIRILVHLLHKINKPMGELGLAFGYIDLFCAQSKIDATCLHNDSLVFQLFIKAGRAGASHRM